MNEETILKIELPDFRPIKSGKVRDIFDLEDNLLFVTSDRISAFDCIMPNGIPDKGKILTQISVFWFNFLKNIIPNHVLTSNFDEYPQKLKKYGVLRKRSMLVKKSKVIPVECVVRGYLSGSGWKEYQKNRAICGIKLPVGLRESEKLSEPIFTPTTKEEEGHDISIDFKKVVDLVGTDIATLLKEKSIELYTTAVNYALSKDIIIADTKFEFGILNNQVILIDEVLTPDSSRFWPKDQYEPGRSQPSFDKQFLRDYLETLDWNKMPPAPQLPKEVILKTRDKYFEAYKKITGQDKL
ncbi:phosphoribosylaminoimidazolesuccinocarboxamide synthase [candidate division WOR-1 bacterium RIFOXYA2_FULL_36_21]|uniref:Phosphoribosylaminoimidazole-succinocarboxamide synthase n=1 Tax=candidate division WOR-1 bacterium RIFOXYB2_FULL_36_35 TaxID=1802578 RepID=A0A1F4S6A7_UNCSA|nr:MAG: phosphoribosylaminoimidazolesuccinocarboxamide synthase [candidate division WOR-1 bacterium RIFOXYA2_FULL_36_21]OGC14268.1 MAG: phosphoribosylaminoimidazolesuccinocarboxamide synthase [candidate division WOR-1 bacterium RIFOXYA12_FULL_36_13]OGC15273.1 MAG: phosphoribosylaminoimidazolesuccinocarboxamide synthase [candidate division WOR-1 bacterium RIFOXYB2_FULL_36_35]